MRRFIRSSSRPPPEPIDIPTDHTGVLQVCHPRWRGVRASAYAYGDPVIESRDLTTLIAALDDVKNAGISTIVIQGWPHGASLFAAAAAGSGLDVLAVFHSSPAQHGIDGGEAEAVGEMLDLQASGVIRRVATVKAGTVNAYRSLGFNVVHTPNRVPSVDHVDPKTVAEGINVGIFLHPMWRKNVTTQVMAALALGWRPFVMADPQVPYISRNDLTIVGELPQPEFLAVQAAMDITLNVTFSECHPMMPMESYRLGIPCLISRTSDLFTDDATLYNLTSIDRPDDPEAIAAAAERLLARRDEAIRRAATSLDSLDRRAASMWETFTCGDGT